ncbi:MAG: hypothetical protein IT260_24160 [Saprospiraceae bacterium]|nr:hypothetical protein [Saprospiraceae bacterium]
MRMFFYTPAYMLILMLVFNQTSQGQCTIKVVNLTDTQNYGCTAVTALPQGVTSSSNACGLTPYTLIGGAYTFTFSPAVPAVRVNLSAINNDPGMSATEEVAFYVNGVFYPITVPGVPLVGCGSPALISPTGTIQACNGCVSSWADIVITETISTLTIEVVHIVGNQTGISFSLYLCCAGCFTFAGEMSSLPVDVCAGNTTNLPPSIFSALESNDILHYIMFSNLSDTLGSILATSTTPNFSFNPATMTLGVPYYIAAIAGNNLGGNVDFNDPCLDISNATPVTWRPRPTVEFAVVDPNVCAGACTTVTANLTGTPPFILTYTTPVSGPTAVIVPTNSSSFQACAPPGAPAGSLLVQATQLADAYCTCP